MPDSQIHALKITQLATLCQTLGTLQPKAHSTGAANLEGEAGLTASHHAGNPNGRCYQKLGSHRKKHPLSPLPEREEGTTGS